MKSKWLAAFVAVAAVTCGVGIWYYVVLRAFEDLSLQFANLRSGTEASRPQLKELDGGRREVSFGVLTNYTSLYKKQRVEMMQIQQSLREGKGMSFWLPDARKE
ncbi:MAG: hypothetical protein Q8P51_10975, partial [Ignavibacteria bacterium]|nr:hypothetical protein [Ignavibacteria bacterium]